MELAVAVAAASPVTAQAVVPLQLGRSAPIAVAVGDEGGTVMLLHPCGQLLVEFDTGEQCLCCRTAAQDGRVP